MTITVEERQVVAKLMCEPDLSLENRKNLVVCLSMIMLDEIWRVAMDRTNSEVSVRDDALNGLNKLFEGAKSYLNGKAEALS